MRALVSCFLFFILFVNTVIATDFYWVNGTGNWSDFSGHWATTSGGTTMQTAVPGSGDNVYFDANSFTAASQTVTINVSIAQCRHMDWTGVTNNPTLAGSSANTIEVYRNLIFAAGMTNNFLGTFNFASTSSANVNSQGHTFNGDCIFEGIGTWNLLNSFTCLGDIYLNEGSLKSNNNAITANAFFSTPYSVRSLTLGTSIVEITGNDTVWEIQEVNFFLTPGTSEIQFTNTTSDEVYVSPGGSALTYADILVDCSNLTFIRGSKGNQLSAQAGADIKFYSDAVHNWTSFDFNGTCNAYITLGSMNTDSIAEFNSSGTSSCSYIIISNINGATGTYNATNSVNEGNVTNWTITDPPSTGYVTWIGNTGNWNDPTNWSTGCLPGPLDTVLFNAGSFSGANDTVYLDINGYAYDMRWQGVTGNPVFAGSGYDVFLRRSVVLASNMVYEMTGELEFKGTTAGTITTNGVTLNGNIRLNGTGSWSLADDLTSNSDLVLETGTFSSNNMDVSVEHFNTDYSNTRTLNLTGSTWNMNGDGETFIINASSLTLNEGTSEIHFNTTSSSTAYFIGAYETYNNLHLHNKSTLMGGGNNFSILEIDAGNELILENAATQSIDSLIANGTCDTPISFSAYTMSSGAAVISKTGYDTLMISYVNINHVTAVNTAPNYNLNTGGTLINTTTGWSTTATGAGANFYWRGSGGSWSDVSEWDSPITGVPATCLPGIKDTVLFDLLSFTGAGQTVLIDITASCAEMDWTGSSAFSPVLTFERDLYVRQNVTLNSGITVNSTNADASIRFIPSGNDCILNSFDQLMDVDIMMDAANSTDILELGSDLQLENNSGIYLLQGTFMTNNDSISCGSFVVDGTDAKTINLGSSYIKVYDLTDFTGTHTLTPGTSTIYSGWNNVQSDFYGGGKTFNKVILNGTNNGVTDLTGSNTFANLTLNPGIRCRIESSQTQTVTGTFSAVGGCADDSIYIYTDLSFFTTNINCSVSPTVEVCEVTNIVGTGSAMNALFSTNAGGNTNWNFIATQPTDADFTTTFDVCLGGSSTFTNTSTAYSGGIGVLTFEWDFGDGDSSTAVNPTHTYTTDDVYYVTLTSTYTNGCETTEEDSVRVNDADIFFSSTDADYTICSGSSVTFNANSAGASNFQFFVNGVSVQNSAASSYTTSTLTNNAEIFVRVTLNGCLKDSDTLTFTVNALPVITLASSDADNTICTGDAVSFYFGGGAQYSYYINAVSQGILSYTDTVTLSNITNGQIFTLQGKDTTTGCTNFSATSLTFTVNPLPTPAFTSSDVDNAICAGTSVTFTGAGASLYEFFINGVSQQGPSATTTFTTTALTNGNVVTMEGTTTGCTVLSSNSYTFFVFSLPTVAMSASPGNSICAGQSVTFTATGASLYQFFVNAVSVQAASGSGSYTSSALANGNIVTVQGTTNGCAGNIPSITMAVTALPVVTLASSDADNSICFGESVTFTAGGASTYQFYVNGVSQQGPSATNTFTTSSIQNSQTVTVAGTSSGCSGNGTTSYTFTVLPPFTVNFYCFDADLAICQGDNIDFTATGVGITSFELFVNGVSFATNATGVFNITTLPAGSQVVTVVGYKNGCSQVSATSFTVNVTAIPTVVLTSNDADNIICSGQSVTFTATGASTYEFFISGNSQGGFTSSDTLVTSSLVNGQTVTVTGSTNGCSSPGAGSFTFTVTALPTVTLASSDIDNIICQGSSITFTSGGASTYEFFVGGVSVQGPSAVNTYSSSSITNGQVVYAAGVNSGCSANSSSYGITVNSNPAISGTISDADTTICAGDNVMLTATGASLFEFFIDGVSTGAPSITNTYSTTTLTHGQELTFMGTSGSGCSSSLAGFYDFTVNALPVVLHTTTDADQVICAGESVTFNASGASAYEFYLNGNLVDSAAVYITSSLVDGDVISVTGTTNGCSANGDSSYLFDVYNYPVVSIGTSNPSLVACQGDPVDIIGYGGLEYEFFVNGVSVQGPSTADTLTTSTLTNGQTVTVDALNNGCASTSSGLTFTVNAYPLVTVNSTDADDEICYGESVTFTASNASTYSFLINGVDISGNTSSATFASTTLEDNDTVTIIGYNGTCAQQSADLFNMTVHTMDLDLTSNSNNMICNGDNVSFTANGADEYEFFVDGVTVQGPAASATYSSSSLTDGQVVSVYGTNFTTGCVQLGQVTQLFMVLDAPTITPAGPIQICGNDSVQLTASSATNLTWYVDGIEIPDESTTAIWVNTSGSYQAAAELGGLDEVLSVGKNTVGQLGDSTFLSSLTLNETAVLQNDIDEVEAGKEFAIAVTSGGDLYAWGRNDFGQLGDGTFGNTNYPKQVSTTNVADAAAGGQHVIAVLSGGTAVSFGRNVNGQLGLGNNATTNFPFPVTGVTGAVACAAGFEHSLILKDDGSIVSFGSNQFGQLGNGSLTNANSPVSVINIPGAVSIAAGAYHSMAIDSSGNLWVWGNNAEGQLGLNTISFSTTPVANGLTEVIQASGGQVHSLAVTDNKKLYTWGGNDYGQLGDGTVIAKTNPQLSTLSAVAYAKAGIYASYVRKSDNSVWCTGRNGDGQLGNSSTADVLTPVHIPEMTGAKDFAGGWYHTNFLGGAQSTCFSNTVVVTVDASPAVSVTMVDTLLTATQTGVAYQWYINGIPIVDGTSQSLDPTAPGYYSVTVTYANGCQSTSTEFPFEIVGIAENEILSFELYPNPTNGNVNLQVSGISGNTNIEVLDLSGRLIYSRTHLINAAGTLIHLDFTAYEYGVYLVRLNNGKVSAQQKVVKLD